jgi:hypothetical protein
MWIYMLVPESGCSPPPWNEYTLPKDLVPEGGGRNNRDSYVPTRSAICHSNHMSLLPLFPVNDSSMLFGLL